MENHHQTCGDSIEIRDESKVGVVVLSMPFQGHQNQLMHLCRVLSSYDNISVHFVGPEIHNRMAKIRAQDWDPLSIPNLHFHDFPVAPFEAPPPNPNDPNKFPAHLLPLIPAMLELKDPIEELVEKLGKSCKRVAIITDIIMSWVVEDLIIPSPRLPNVEMYCFHVFPAFALYYFACGYAGKPVLLFEGDQSANDLPTLEAVFGKNVLLPYFKSSIESGKCYHGNLYNCSRVIEGEVLNRLEEENLNDAEKHWAVGPLNLVKTMMPPLPVPVAVPVPVPAAAAIINNNDKRIFEWLDEQRPRSVIYVAFGTATSFSDEQVKEIALGLERSGHSFIWLLRHADTADYNSEGGGGRGGDEDELRLCKSAELPHGFEERIGGKGMIIRGDQWVPQLKILGHPSTGGFLSHCGWNSCIESISMGVPIAAWPMHSEQPLNAILIQRVLRIGVLVRECTIQIDEIVRSVTIENAIKTLMGSPEGEEMRQRAEKLGAAVRKSVEKDGDVVAEIASFVDYISR